MGSYEAVSRVLVLAEGAESLADLAALVETYAPLLYRVAFSVVRNAAEAEDTVQDTFVRVLEHRGTLPAVRDMRLWLVRITWNLALDRRRRVRAQELDAEMLERLADTGATAEQQVDQARRARLVLDALDRLPKAERQALLLSAVEECTTAEVAAVLGRTESAVRGLVSRARSRLRTRLQGKGV